MAKFHSSGPISTFIIFPVMLLKKKKEIQVIDKEDTAVLL